MYNVAISSYVKLFSIDYKVILNVQSLKTTSFFEIMFIRTITLNARLKVQHLYLFHMFSAVAPISSFPCFAYPPAPMNFRK